MTMNQLYNVVVFFKNYYSDDVEWDTTDGSGPDGSGPDASLVKPYLPSIPEESVRFFKL